MTFAPGERPKGLACGLATMGTVEKAFQIIERIVAKQGRGLSFSEVVLETNFPKASTHRILKSLVRLGYLRADTETGRYYGDLGLSRLGSEVMSHFDLKNYVRPHLLKLHEEIHHTCHLGIRSGNVGVYLDKIEAPERYGIKLFSAVGKNFPLHCTGMGKVLLAFLDSGERRTVLSRRLDAFTQNTITDAGRLERELKKIHRCGYAVDREEITRGIMCVAAPIENHRGQVVAAISVTFPTYVQKDRGIAKEIRAVARCAATVSARLKGKIG